MRVGSVDVSHHQGQVALLPHTSLLFAVELRTISRCNNTKAVTNRFDVSAGPDVPIEAGTDGITNERSLDNVISRMGRRARVNRQIHLAVYGGEIVSNSLNRFKRMPIPPALSISSAGGDLMRRLFSHIDHISQ